MAKRLTMTYKDEVTTYDPIDVTYNSYSRINFHNVLKKLAHYEDLEEQGRLVLFPNYAFFIKDGKIYEGWVQSIEYCVCRKPLLYIRYDDNSLDSYRGYLGNTVFLTKEEAEAKLKER